MTTMRAGLDWSSQVIYSSRQGSCEDGAVSPHNGRQHSTTLVHPLGSGGNWRCIPMPFSILFHPE